MDDGVCDFQSQAKDSFPDSRAKTESFLVLWLVYTCQLPQLTRCDFFLWQDEAKAREVAAVFKNASSKPLFSSPHTPVKNHSALFTPPTTVERSDSANVGSSKIPPSPSTPSRSSGNFLPLVQSTHSSNPTIKATAAAEEDDDENEEFFDWPSSDDEELSAASNLSSKLMPPPPITPRKAMKTDAFSTPGKRSNDDETNPLMPISKLNFSARNKATIEEDDVFTTPTTATPRTPGLFSNYNKNNLPSPTETPMPRRFRDIPGGQDSDLAMQVLQVFERKKISLSSELKDEVRAIANKHNMYTRGVISGRDISRAMIKKKAEEIIELQGTIAGLEAEREVQYSLIQHLRRELVEK